MSEIKNGICEVHKYALEDETERKVVYCNECRAWICEECQPKLLLRALAFLVRKLKIKK